MSFLRGTFDDELRIGRFQQLDSTMQTISAKVVHLGDQLDSVHAPRARAFEALQLMRHFDEFYADQPLSSPIFTDTDRVNEHVALKLLSSHLVLILAARIGRDDSKAGFDRSRARPQRLSYRSRAYKPQIC